MFVLFDNMFGNNPILDPDIIFTRCDDIKKNIMKRNFYNESMAFLEAIANGSNGIQPKKYLDDNIIGKINAAQVRLKPKTHYIRRKFSAADLSGIQDMLKDQLTDKIGVNTFNGKSLSGMNYFIPNGIKIK